MEKKVIKKQNQGRNCIVCGVDNESGLHGEFFELEDGTLEIGRASCRERV